MSVIDFKRENGDRLICDFVPSLLDRRPMANHILGVALNDASEVVALLRIAPTDGHSAPIKVQDYQCFEDKMLDPTPIKNLLENSGTIFNTGALKRALQNIAAKDYVNPKFGGPKVK